MAPKRFAYRAIGLLTVVNTTKDFNATIICISFVKRGCILIGAFGSTACASPEINTRVTIRFRIQQIRSISLCLLARAYLKEKMTGRGKGKAAGYKVKEQVKPSGSSVSSRSHPSTSSQRQLCRARRRGCSSVLGCHTRVSKC